MRFVLDHWSISRRRPAAFVGISVPPFVAAVLLQLLFAIVLTRWFGLDKPFLPTSGVYPAGHKGFDLVLLANLLADVLYAVLDPRIRLD